MEAGELLTVRCSRVGFTETITLAGDLDALTAPLLAAAVAEAVQAGVGKIIIDCVDLEFLDSSGIAALVVAWNDMAGRAEMPLVVTNVQPGVRRVIDVCGITDLLFE